MEWAFENIIQIMWLPCSQLSSGFSSHWDEKQILTTTCKTTPSGSLPPLWHESLSPPYSLHLHHIWCCSDMAIAFLPWGLCSSPCTLSAFPPGSHLAYSFTSFWPLLRRHAWNIIAALEGGNSWKKEIQSVSQKMNSKAVLQIYSTLSPYIQMSSILRVCAQLQFVFKSNKASFVQLSNWLYSTVLQ